MEKLYLILEIIKEYRNGTLLADITVLLVFLVVFGVLRLIFGDKKVLKAINFMIYSCLVIMGIILIYMGFINSNSESFGNLFIALGLIGLLLVLGTILYIWASRLIKDKRKTQKGNDKNDK